MTIKKTIKKPKSTVLSKKEVLSKIAPKRTSKATKTTTTKNKKQATKNLDNSIVSENLTMQELDVAIENLGSQDEIDLESENSEIDSEIDSENSEIKDEYTTPRNKGGRPRGSTKSPAREWLSDSERLTFGTDAKAALEFLLSQARTRTEALEVSKLLIQYQTPKIANVSKDDEKQFTININSDWIPDNKL